MEQALSLYKIFYTVAKNGNISKAAKELYISQPAISKSISKLEQNLSTILFVRSSRGVSLTNEGKILYEHIETAFDAIMQGEENIRKINKLGIGHLRLGVSTTLCKYILLSYLKNFIEMYPHIKITIDCQSTFHSVNLLENKKIDIGLIVKPEILKELDFYSIGKVEDVFVATDTYLENLKLREPEAYTNVFESANIMLLDKKNITRMYIDNYMKKNSIEANNILEISNMDLLIEFAKIGLGVACVIKEFVQDDLNNGSLIEIPLSSPIPKREVGFAYYKNISLTDSMKKFIHFYKSPDNCIY